MDILNWEKGAISIIDLYNKLIADHSQISK